MAGWGAPKQAPTASQGTSLAPGMLSQSMGNSSLGNNLLSSLQVRPLVCLILRFSSILHSC